MNQRAKKTVLIVNSGAESAMATIAPLATQSIFSIVNAARPVPPGGSFKLIIAFVPQVQPLLPFQFVLPGIFR